MMVIQVNLNSFSCFCFCIEKSHTIRFTAVLSSSFFYTILQMQMTGLFVMAGYTPGARLPLARGMTTILTTRTFASFRLLGDASGWSLSKYFFFLFGEKQYIKVGSKDQTMVQTKVVRYKPIDD